MRKCACLLGWVAQAGLAWAATVPGVRFEPVPAVIRAGQRAVLRITLGVAAALLIVLAILCWLPWGAIRELAAQMDSQLPPEQGHQLTVYSVRCAGGLAAWVGVLVLLPTANPRRYAAVIDVSIGMLVVLALVAALLGSHLHVPAILYLGGAMLCGLLATVLGALRGAATYRGY